MKTNLCLNASDSNPEVPTNTCCVSADWTSADENLAPTQLDANLHAHIEAACLASHPHAWRALVLRCLRNVYQLRPNVILDLYPVLPATDWRVLCNGYSTAMTGDERCMPAVTSSALWAFQDRMPCRQWFAMIDRLTPQFMIYLSDPDAKVKPFWMYDAVMAWIEEGRGTPDMLQTAWTWHDAPGWFRRKLPMLPTALHPSRTLPARKRRRGHRDGRTWRRNGD